MSQDLSIRKFPMLIEKIANSFFRDLREDMIYSEASQ